ncbi:hypothetical protein KUTeg_006047 [Tegillarca granosa]|uniref:Ig-like domain-containing protein n=1 Tax=Tegillarca granosa TaxID=220873 RepID=A0ABQ9FJZ8_TEGGR|nr:hypothetical protein KUTeg_006047 [Tegillarca granosa]
MTQILKKLKLKRLKIRKIQPEIKNITYFFNGGAKLVINNEQVLTVSENDDINLQCNIEANPKASISWKRDGEVLKHNSSGESLIYNLGQSISCETSGIYSCVADNRIMSAVQRNVSLRVMIDQSYPNLECRFIEKSKPKQSTHSSVSNRYGSRLNSTVNVSLSIFAYPRPQHRWTSNTTGTIIERPTSVINSYSFKYEGLVNMRRATDFGGYCLELTNDKGSSRVCLQIQKEVSTDFPKAPTSFTVDDILHGMISLTWISEYDGGKEQTFYLEYREKENNSSSKILIYKIVVEEIKYMFL